MYDIRPAAVSVTAEKVPCCICGTPTYRGSEFDLTTPASREAAINGGIGFQCQNQNCCAVFCFSCISEAATLPIGKGKACRKCGLGTMDVLKNSTQIRTPGGTFLEGAKARLAQVDAISNVQRRSNTTPIGSLTFEAMLHSYAVTAEGLHWAYVREKDRVQWVVLDGVKGPEYLAIQKSTLTFSPDGERLAYVICRGTETLAHRALLVDGVEGRPYDQIPNGSMVFSPDCARVAYIAERERTLRVVVDEEEGKSYESLLPTLVFSPDSRRVAYVACRAGKWLSVVGEVEGQKHDFVDGLVFTPNGQHLAGVVKRASSWFLTVDDEPIADAFEGVLKGNIAFYPDSRRVTFAVKRAGKSTVIADGALGKAYNVIAKHSLHISANGSRIAYAAKDNGKVFAVVDGVEGKGYDGIHWGTPIFSPDSKHVVYVAKRGEYWLVVVDGEEGGIIPGKGLPFPERNRLVFDSPNSFHILALNGIEFLRFDVRI